MKPRYLVAVVALVAAFGIGLAALIVRSSAQTGMNHAALIVRMKDGSVATKCVAFSEAEISGYDLLRRSQMPVIADVSNGVSICKIGPSSGCNFPAQKCFCDCQDLNGTCIYWMYYYQDKGQWKYAALGAAAQKVKNGDINGWVYDVGTTSGGTFPPVISYEQICDAAPPPVTPDAHPVTPTATTLAATATAMSVVTPTDTAQPTVTSTPLTAAQAEITATLTVQPSASPTTVVTPTVTLTPVPSATATAIPSATAPAQPSPTPTPEATSGQSSNVIGYAVFGVIAVGLIGALLITRRNSGKVSR
jgi:hypothetical protein